MDLVRLRSVLEPFIISLKDAGTHPDLPSICEELGLPKPDAGDSKRERMTASFNALADSDLPAVAEKFLSRRPPSAATRNLMQDILWSNRAGPTIPKRFRREVAKAIECEGLYHDAHRFDELLDRLWILDTDPWATLRASLRGESVGLRAEIERHVHRNPEDWSAECAFEVPDGFFDASAARRSDRH